MKLVFISDIHFTGSRPESEGMVLTAFLEDLNSQICDSISDEVFVLVGGDLVQAADNASSYDMLYDKLFVPMFKMGINKDHFIFVPGNHDVQRGWV